MTWFILKSHHIPSLRPEWWRTILFAGETVCCRAKVSLSPASHYCSLLSDRSSSASCAAAAGRRHASPGPHLPTPLPHNTRIVVWGKWMRGPTVQDCCRRRRLRLCVLRHPATAPAAPSVTNLQVGPGQTGPRLYYYGGRRLDRVALPNWEQNQLYRQASCQANRNGSSDDLRTFASRIRGDESRCGRQRQQGTKCLAGLTRSID